MCGGVTWCVLLAGECVGSACVYDGIICGLEVCCCRDDNISGGGGGGGGGQNVKQKILGAIYTK